jgi:hypothetical protein
VRRLIVHDGKAGVLLHQLLQRAGKTHVVLPILGGDGELIDRESAFERASSSAPAACAQQIARRNRIELANRDDIALGARETFLVCAVVDGEQRAGPLR